MKLQKRQSPEAYCPSAAIVDPEDYVIKGPADKSRASFELWVNELAVKYPDLKMRYALLLDCWTFYSEES